MPGGWRPSPPCITTHPWTAEELNKAERLLSGADWPTLTNIYEHVKAGDHKLIPKASLVSEGRVLQLSLLKAMQRGHFGRLTEALRQGQRGMKTFVYTDHHEDGRFDQYYEKTAGDMVQSHWCRRHLADMSDCFQYNKTQAAIARWLQLPRLVLPQDVANKVIAWAVHPLADFQEQLTLYLPSKLVALYMEICTSYYVHFVKPEGTSTTCQHRNDCGLLCCDYAVHGWYGRFCSYAHFADSRHRAAYPRVAVRVPGDPFAPPVLCSPYSKFGVMMVCSSQGFAYWHKHVLRHAGAMRTSRDRLSMCILPLIVCSSTAAWRSPPYPWMCLQVYHRGLKGIL